MMDVEPEGVADGCTQPSVVEIVAPAVGRQVKARASGIKGRMVVRDILMLDFPDAPLYK
jgi:hypothetical protein